MALPKAVQAQEDAANAFLDGGEQPANKVNTSEQAHQQPAQPAIPQIPEAQPEAAPVGNTDQTAEIEALKHQMAVLNGKYQAEVPKLAEQNRTLREENETLKGQLQEKAAVTDMSEAMEALSEFLDQPQIEAMQKVINGQIAAAVAPLNQAVETAQQEVVTTRQNTQEQAKSTFYTNLQAWAPNWKQLNKDAGFDAFLKNTARDGKALSQVIGEKFSVFDAAGVAAIFNEYSNKAGVDPLADQIMPGRSQGGHTQETNQPQNWTGEMIDELYAKQRRGLVTAEQVAEAEAQFIGA